jgi:RHS repeat-associated protein
MLKTIYPESGDLNDVIYTYGASGDGKNGAGRIVKIKQGDNFKTDNFKYDILGNVIYEKKKINVPLAGDREFISEFGYDSWGRILEMTYPDGEKVAYNYNTSGDLSRIDGYLPNAGPTYIILDYLQYAGFGNIIKQAYGNGALTEFTYDANRRMKGVELNSNSHQLLDKTYSYDDLGNIADVINAASALSLNGNTIGGEYEISGINYDGLNQVSSLSQRFGPTSAPVHNISMDMTYSAGGRLLFKNLDDQAGGTSDYSLNYLYDVSSGKDHQLKTVQNAAGNDFSFDYNNVGSIIQKTEIDGAAPGTDLVEDFCWNEHQTLRRVKRGTEDRADLAHYVYDHSGERVLKTIITGSILNTNSQGQSAFSMESPTVYVNPYYIASHYLETELASKHYYMGGQRIASSLISLPFNTGSQTDPGMGGEGEEGEGPVFGEGNLSTSEDAVIQDLSATFNCLFGRTIELDYEGMLKLSSIGEPILFDDCEGGESSEASEIDPTCACEQSTYWAQIGGVACNTMPIMYWYHPDYLGSVEFVTDMAGDPYQFFHNTIWGENLQNHMAFNFKSFSSRFRFNEGRALRNRPVAYFSEGARLPRWQWDEEPTLGSSRAPLKEEWGEQTGNFYYGARYYDPKISVWLSVDPLASDYPSLSPYVFVANSPVNAIDPDGRRIVWSIDAIRVGFSMMWTKKGRENWRAMRKDKFVDFKFRVSSSVGVDKRSDGSWSLVEGHTYKEQGSECTMVVSIYKGTNKIKKGAEKRHDKDWHDIEEKYQYTYINTNVRVAGEGIELIGDHGDQTGNIYNMDDTYSRDTYEAGSDHNYWNTSRKNESGVEYIGRLGRHESTHALIESGVWKDPSPKNKERFPQERE